MIDANLRSKLGIQSFKQSKPKENQYHFSNSRKKSQEGQDDQFSDMLDNTITDKSQLREINRIHDRSFHGPENLTDKPESFFDLH